MADPLLSALGVPYGSEWLGFLVCALSLLYSLAQRIFWFAIVVGHMVNHVESIKLTYFEKDPFPLASCCS